MNNLKIKYIQVFGLKQIVLGCLSVIFANNNISAVNNPYVGQCLPCANDLACFLSSEANNGGRHIDYVETWFDSPKPLSDLSQMIDACYNTYGSILEICWQPGGASFGEIIAGSHDAYVTSFAQECAAVGHPMNIRIWHEFNLDAPDPDAFRGAWRHLVDIFRAQGANNVRWVYCVNMDGPGSFMDPYPGDDYVDYMGMDGYNWGNTESWSNWDNFEFIFSNAYNAIKVVNKPIIICEWGCVEGGGNKAEWITDAWYQMRFSGNYDMVCAELWFDLAWGGSLESSFTLNTSPVALQAYVEATNYESDPIWDLSGPSMVKPALTVNANDRTAEAAEMKTFDLRGRTVPLLLKNSAATCLVKLPVSAVGKQEAKLFTFPVTAR